MRFIIANFILICALLFPALAQQTDSSNQTNQKKPPAAKNEKKNDNATKPPETPSSEEHNPEAAKDASTEKEEPFDVSEVAPVVTHHQITVDGKLLKYTATAGRLPIKREDGK